MAGSEDSDPKIQSAITSLKQLLTIISGLAATNSVLQLLLTTQESGQYSAARLQLIPLLLFIVNILTIARFYHGNYRQLDEEYSGSEGKGGQRSLLSGSARVAADFTVMLIEALLLSVSSFLFSQPLQYITLISALLILDSIWFFFAHTGQSEVSALQNALLSEKKSKVWALNNVVFGIIFVIMSRLNVEVNETFVLVFAALALINFSVDILTEFRFYFPRPETSKWDVFIGAPFTDRHDNEGNWHDVELRTLIDALQVNLSASGYAIYSAHSIEQYGEQIRDPENALVEDLAAVGLSKIIVAIVTSPPSPGLQIELGAAVTLQKPIIQVSKQGVDLPYLNKGFAKLTDTSRIRYRTPGDCVKSVRQELIRKKVRASLPIHSDQ